MNKEDEVLWRDCIGLVIMGANLSEEALTLVFERGVKLVLYDVPDCCENRYMRSDDSTLDLIGARLLSIEERSGPDIPTGDSGEHETAFVNVLTDCGQFQLVMHNEHNGYYGGINLHISTELSPFYN